MRLLRKIRLIAAALFAAAPLPAEVVVSQIYGGGGNAGATLRNDFIELFNRGAARVDLDGWSVQYASATGGTWQVTPLRGSIAPGSYYLVEQAAGAGGTQPLPDPDAAGQVAMSATAGKVALVRATRPLEGNQPRDAAIEDLVGYGTADFAEGTPARALSNTAAALRAGGGCVDTDNNVADFQVAAPAPRNSASPAADCSASPEPPVTARIHQVQGAGPTSPLAGRTVQTSGIVTARRANGFYIQSAPEDEDADSATSEGLFVFTNAAPPAQAAIGAMVRVTGIVAEFRPASDPASPTLTELTVPVVEPLGITRPLPEPAVLTRRQIYPAGGPHLLEPWEGMRVRIADIRAVSASLGTINETTGDAGGNGIFFAVLEGTARPAREPGADWDGNPERLRIDTAALDPDRRTSARPGDRWRDLAGVVDYAFRTYTILVESLGDYTAAPREDVLPYAPSGHLRFATMNLRRLYDSIDDAATTDVPVSQGYYLARVASIAENIRVRLALPAVIAVQEAENLDVLRRIAQSLSSGYVAYLEEGNDPGGIDVGFLVDTRRVTVHSVRQEEKTASYLTPAGLAAVLHDRPPLVLHATAGGVTFRAVAVHLRSLIGAETPEVQAKRRAQAEAIGDLALRLQQDNPQDGLVVLGDFNAFGFDDGTGDPVGAIAARAGLTDLAATLPVDQGYSYIQDGSAQVLDHILVNPALRSRWTGYRVMHTSTSVPAANRPDSDHDIPIASFADATSSPLIIADSATWRTGAVAPGQYVTVFGPAIDSGTPVRVNGLDAGFLGGGTGFVSVELPLFGGGLASFTIGAREMVLPAAPAVPGIFTARSLGNGRVEVVVNGVGPGPVLHFWVGGRPADLVQADGLRLVVQGDVSSPDVTLVTDTGDSYRYLWN